jgi:hypothetical protein
MDQIQKGGSSLKPVPKKDHQAEAVSAHPLASGMGGNLLARVIASEMQKRRGSLMETQESSSDSDADSEDGF